MASGDSEAMVSRLKREDCKGTKHDRDFSKWQVISTLSHIHGVIFGIQLGIGHIDFSITLQDLESVVNFFTGLFLQIPCLVYIYIYICMYVR